MTWPSPLGLPLPPASWPAGLPGSLLAMRGPAPPRPELDRCEAGLSARRPSQPWPMEALWDSWPKGGREGLLGDVVVSTALLLAALWRVVEGAEHDKCWSDRLGWESEPDSVEGGGREGR